ncbi:Hsp20/alpha crystallin family protein [Candidatus Uhrbacteria bacterium]|nr:Hsp20/alpha crystallin family protein [Candidatus Uhrbacteria bacterium]
MVRVKKTINPTMGKETPTLVIAEAPDGLPEVRLETTIATISQAAQDADGFYDTALVEEGQLAVDIYETSRSLVVKAPIAGVNPEDLDISVNDDMLTIRGRRQGSRADDAAYLIRECYWGNFSRSIILPVDVRAENIEATMVNGVLTITLPKAVKARTIEVKKN